MCASIPAPPISCSRILASRAPPFFANSSATDILVRERSHDLGPGFARITIGTEAELKKLLRLLERNP